MPRYAEDEVRKRTDLSRNIFYQIEEKLVDFLDYVPFDSDHLEVYSHRLITIILEIGPEILSSFDIAVNIIRHRLGSPGNSISKDSEELWKKEENLKKQKKSLTFFDYYRFLDNYSVPKLSRVTIALKDSDAYLMPFEASSPQWWENYNLLRHDKYTNLRTATLRTALNACAALFWFVYQNQKLEGFSSDLFSHISSDYAFSRLKKI